MIFFLTSISKGVYTFSQQCFHGQTFSHQILMAFPQQILTFPHHVGKRKHLDKSHSGSVSIFIQDLALVWSSVATQSSLDFHQILRGGIPAVSGGSCNNSIII